MTDNSLEKIAKRRSGLQKLKEWSNIGRRLSEGVASKYKEHLVLLRKVDDQIRDYYEENSPTNFFNLAKASLKSRAYQRCFSYLTDMNHTFVKVDEMAEELRNYTFDALADFESRQNQLTRSDVEDLHEKTQQLRRNKRKLLERRRSRTAVENLEDHLIKNGFLGDMISGLFLTKEQRELRVLERMYRSQQKKLKADLERLVALAPRIIADIDKIFDEMQEARSKGDPHLYIKALDKLILKADDFTDPLTKVSEEHFAQKTKALYDRIQTARAAENLPPLNAPGAGTGAAALVGGAAAATTSAAGPATTPVVTEPAATEPVAAEPAVVAPANDTSVEEDEEDKDGQPPTTLPTTTSARQLSSLIVNAKAQMKIGNNGLAVRYLVEASEISEKLGATRQSEQLIRLAQSLIGE